MLATVSEKKPSKKKAKVGKDQKREGENASPLLDPQTGPDHTLGIVVRPCPVYIPILQLRKAVNFEIVIAHVTLRRF